MRAAESALRPPRLRLLGGGAGARGGGANVKAALRGGQQRGRTGPPRTGSTSRSRRECCLPEKRSRRMRWRAAAIPNRRPDRRPSPSPSRGLSPTHRREHRQQTRRRAPASARPRGAGRGLRPCGRRLSICCLYHYYHRISSLAWSFFSNVPASSTMCVRGTCASVAGPRARRASPAALLGYPPLETSGCSCVGMVRLRMHADCSK